jgi:hypothetical protein
VARGSLIFPGKLPSLVARGLLFPSMARGLLSVVSLLSAHSLLGILSVLAFGAVHAVSGVCTVLTFGNIDAFSSLLAIPNLGIFVLLVVVWGNLIVVASYKCQHKNLIVLLESFCSFLAFVFYCCCATPKP